MRVSLRCVRFLAPVSILAVLFTVSPLPQLRAQQEEMEETPKVKVEPAVAKAILAAVNDYLKADQSPMAGKITIQVDSLEGDTYRLLVLPKDPESADLADAFVRKQADGSWKVLGLGTGFEEDFYAKENIPASLRDPVAPDIFLPVKPELVTKITTALKEALGKELKLQDKVPFTDYYSQDAGKAALLVLEGNEKEVGTSKSIHEASSKAFKALEWKEDKAYTAEGPSGVTSMYRGPDNAFAFFSAVWNASADSGLSEEDDPTLAKLKPEQKIYRVEWYLGEPAPGQKLSAPTLDAGTGAGDPPMPAAGGDDSLPSN